LDISTLPELTHLLSVTCLVFLESGCGRGEAETRFTPGRTTTTDDDEEEEEGTEEGGNTAALSSPSTTMGAAEAEKDREREFDDEED
jgi:hypothetical protein